MNPTGRRLLGWVAVFLSAATLTATCTGDDPPLPEELRRFEDEPVQEAGCASCHAPGGTAEDVPATGTELPMDHPATDPGTGP